MLFQGLRGVTLEKVDSYRGYDAYGNQNFGNDRSGPVGASYDSSTRTAFSDMSRYLRNVLGQPCTYYLGTSDRCTDFALKTVKDGAVAVGSIGWYPGAGRKGGHWVIFDRVSSFAGNKDMVASDPWDGQVHVFPVRAGQSFFTSQTTVRAHAPASSTACSTSQRGQKSAGSTGKPDAPRNCVTTKAGSHRPSALVLENQTTVIAPRTCIRSSRRNETPVRTYIPRYYSPDRSALRGAQTIRLSRIVSDRHRTLP